MGYYNTIATLCAAMVLQSPMFTEADYKISGPQIPRHPWFCLTSRPFPNSGEAHMDDQGCT